MTDERDEYPTYFEGPCTCEHDESEHGWGNCDVSDCDCKAGWTE